jgi:hypothetical protein
MREQQAGEFPRPVALSLAGYTVERIERDDARKLILRYEWLGTMGRTNIFIGLLSPERELYGVACFGHGPQPVKNGGISCSTSKPLADIGHIIGVPVLCLERGACVHYAPPNAASYLITRATKLIYRDQGVARFYAYADPNAGEYGGIYQACNWVYLGQGLWYNGKERPFRTFVLPPGKEDVPTNWRTTRALRPGKDRSKWLNYERAEALGWRIIREKEKGREAKHVYAINVGPDRKAWRRQFEGKPYPAPQPELKRIKPLPG